MNTYTSSFYREQREGSRRSASIVLPLIFEVIEPKTVVDVGCGVGTWLGVAKSMGKEVLGLDGEYVDREMLEIPKENFSPTDVSKPITHPRRFDLALCLEVGEHIPTSSSETLVKSLISLADAVAFSAAIPMQGGNNHINEQWQSYWVELFSRHGYMPVDFIRSQVWSDERVEDFYAQNLIVFCSKALIESNPTLKASFERSPRNMFNLIHPKRYLYNMDIANISTKKIIKALPGKIMRGIAYRFRRRGD